MRTFAILAVTAAVFATLGATPALATTVVCGQVITQSIKVSNDLSNCPADGLVVGANNMKIDHGTIQQFTQGIHLVGATKNKVDHVTVTQTLRGIEVQAASNENKIEHNKVSGNFDGIHLVGSDANKIDHNDVFGNTASAIVLITGSDNNKVEHNKAHDNATWGITQDASNNNVYRHNKIYKNNTAGFEPFNSSGLRFEHNDLKQNRIGIELFNTDASFITDNKIQTSTLDGIHSFNGSTGNLFKKNHVDKNGADGIDVLDAGNTIAKNHADKNVNLGIFAAAGNIDGGGNKEKKNGNAAQCVGVTCH